METAPTGYRLPVPSTSLTGEVDFRYPLLIGGAAAVLSFPYRIEGQAHRGRLVFRKVRAFSHRAEIHCTVDQIRAYDVLTEVLDSPWAAELRDVTNQYQRDQWVMRHFRIYFDSAGCYEFLCDSWDADDEVLA
jgi:hypothetical protein